jgi:class 3 adenylate cyclase
MPVRTSLGGFAPHRLLRRLIAGPSRALAYERDLTVMFTDIAGFTELAESLPPSAVAELLRGHLGALAERIESERGIVDKVLGDGLLAFWDLHDDRYVDFDPRISEGLGLPTWVNHLAFAATDVADLVRAIERSLARPDEPELAAALAARSTWENVFAAELAALERIRR